MNTRSMRFFRHDHGYDMYAHLELFSDNLGIKISRRIEIDPSWGFEDYAATIESWEDWTQEKELLFLSGADLEAFVVELVPKMCSCEYEIMSDGLSETAFCLLVKECEEVRVNSNDGRLADGGMSQIDEFSLGEKWTSLTPWRFQRNRSALP